MALWIILYGAVQASAPRLLHSRTASAGAATSAARRWAGPMVMLDTDARMTAGWCEMLLGQRPVELLRMPKADLYLLLESDLPWVDDGTRFFADPAYRQRFAAIVEQVLVDADVPFVRISGTGEARLEAAKEAIGALDGQTLVRHGKKQTVERRAAGDRDSGDRASSNGQ